MRVRLNTRSHPMGELTFNPDARPGDPDWRVLYGEVGDGASGESRIVAIRNNPQRLDNLVGKIIRIIPDLNEQRRHEHGQRERPLSHSERQPVREDEGRAARNLGVRPSQSAPAELGARSGEPAGGEADRQLRRLPHVGNGEHHRAREQSRLALSRRQPGAVARPAIAWAAARGRQDSHADRRRDHRRGRHAEISGHSVRARRERRRCDRQRATSTTAS